MKLRELLEGSEAIEAQLKRALLTVQQELHSSGIDDEHDGKHIAQFGEVVSDVFNSLRAEFNIERVRASEDHRSVLILMPDTSFFSAERRIERLGWKFTNASTSVFVNPRYQDESHAIHLAVLFSDITTPGVEATISLVTFTSTGFGMSESSGNK